MAKKRRRDRKRAERTPVEATPAEPSEGSQPPPAGGKAPGSPAEAPAAPPRSRRATNLFILLFLAFQIVMPLRYYLGDLGYDERFSWRMFSSVRLQRCRVEVQDVRTDGARRDVDLPSELHIAWIRILERARPAAVEKLLERRCAQSDVGEAHYELRCTATDGTTLPTKRVVLDCASGELSQGDAS